MPIHWWMDKENVLFIYNKIIPGHKKDEILSFEIAWMKWNYAIVKIRGKKIRKEEGGWRMWAAEEGVRWNLSLCSYICNVKFAKLYINKNYP